MKIIDVWCWIVDPFEVNKYDAKRQMSVLKRCAISKSEAKQRAGRAGRMQQGYCSYMCYLLLSLVFSSF